VNEFLLGAVSMGFVVVAIFFARFWQRTRDALFLLFAVSFAVQGLGHMMFAVEADPAESRPLFYLPRLLAYCLLLAGIAFKNRGPSER